MDALGMYNMSLQASSWDGSAYGERVGLVQAMMVRFPQSIAHSSGMLGCALLTLCLFHRTGHQLDITVGIFLVGGYSALLLSFVARLLVFRGNSNRIREKSLHGSVCSMPSSRKNGSERL